MRNLWILLIVACSSAPPTPTVATLSGSYSETITLKASSTTCSIAMTIDGVEDASTPWLCPTCTIMYRFPFQLTDGSACLTPILGQLPPDGWIGWSADNKLYVGFGEGFGSLIAGSVAVSAKTVQATISVDNADITRAGTSQLTVGEKAGDREQGWTRSASYRCGWPRTNPPPYTGSYAAAAGNPLPDAVLEDQCGDKVRMHDLLGRYLVLAANQTGPKTCGPCTGASQGQAAFEADIKGLGIDTLVVSLLVPDYTLSVLTPAQSDLQSWASANQVKGVALADRGYGTAVVGIVATHNDLTTFGYPSFVVVAPDGTVLTGTTGFTANMTWTDLETQIKTHAGK
jgi:hypothetical protein